MKPKIILTCEHADFKTPPFLKNTLKLSPSLLRSHRGWDQGAYQVCKNLTQSLKASLFFYPFSRLYIDANRKVSLNALSPFTDELSPQQKNKLVQLSQSYRERIYKAVEKEVKKQRNVYIFSVHSFVPVFKGRKRKTDFGLLYRTQRDKEVELALQLKKSFKDNPLNWSVHNNLPYRGHTDCFLNDLLDKHKKNPLVNGLFFEINQRNLKNIKQIQTSSALVSDVIQQSILKDNI